VVVDKAATRQRRNKLFAMATLCVVTLLVFLAAFGGTGPGSRQFMLIAFGGFLMTCTVGPAAGIVLDVVHPGVRSTGAALLSLFQNLLGLAVGPFVGGAVSDAWGLQTALAAMPVFGLLAAACFLRAARSYESDLRRVTDVSMDAAPEGSRPSAALA
jgi:predicted MFS family arabinose efflux permease